MNTGPHDIDSRRFFGLRRDSCDEDNAHLETGELFRQPTLVPGESSPKHQVIIEVDIVHWGDFPTAAFG